VVKSRLDVVLDKDNLEYLEEFGPREKSKIVGEGLKLHKQKRDNPKEEKTETAEITNVEVEL